MAAEKNPSRHFLTQNSNRVPESFAIALRIARKRRPEAPLLTKGQIAAQNSIAIFGKSFTDRHQQRSSTIRARAVTQNQRVSIRICWTV